MTEIAAHLTDDVVPLLPVDQWVLPLGIRDFVVPSQFDLERTRCRYTGQDIVTMIAA